VQLKSDKARAFKGVQGTTSGVDLMIVDIPEGLPVSMVSSPHLSVPERNSEDKNFLPMVFDFGSFLVHDNGALLLFHKGDLKLRADIRGYCGNMDLVFFCSRPQISTKTGSLKFSNKKKMGNGLL
jgi:hypothetical protein